MSTQKTHKYRFIRHARVTEPLKTKCNQTNRYVSLTANSSPGESDHLRRPSPVFICNLCKYNLFWRLRLIARLDGIHFTDWSFLSFTFLPSTLFFLHHPFSTFCFSFQVYSVDLEIHSSTSFWFFSPVNLVQRVCSSLQLSLVSSSPTFLGTLPMSAEHL